MHRIGNWHNFCMEDGAKLKNFLTLSYLYLLIFIVLYFDFKPLQNMYPDKLFLVCHSIAFTR